jgi:hypothetical protein
MYVFLQFLEVASFVVCVIMEWMMWFVIAYGIIVVFAHYYFPEALKEAFFNLFFSRHTSLILRFFTEKTSYCVYVTDGGHVDNLGLFSALYELKRKPIEIWPHQDPKILCFDAGADSSLSCDGLLKSLEMAQSPEYMIIDRYEVVCDPALNIQLKGNSFWKSAAPPGFKSVELESLHCMVIEVVLHKPELRNEHKVRIYYAKSIVTGEEKTLKLGLYLDQEDGYPFHPTADQTFPWNISERYRVLGKEVAEICLRKIQKQKL